MLPRSVDAAVVPYTGPISVALPLSGGCIAHASRLDAENGVYFLKWAVGAAGAGFDAEAAGLRALGAAAPAGIAVPRPLASSASSEDAPGYLLTEWIQWGPDAPGRAAHFGASLARLHRAAAPAPKNGMAYGFGIDTFCGPTRQPNGWMETWPDFFRERRLQPMAERLRAAGRWPAEWDAPFDRLLASLDARLPARPAAALLHGDLWSGNTFACADGGSALVDPAVYVGDREADLAMTELFGGFDDAFYRAYREEWPLDPGYEGRRATYNLYHLMNHLLLFGGGYAESVARGLGAGERPPLTGE